MNPKVLTVEEDRPVEQLAEYLTENCISGAPVTSEDGTLIGVVSLTDIVRHKTLPVGDSELKSPHDYYLHAIDGQYAPEDMTSFRLHGESLATVRDIMTPMVFSVETDASVRDVADTMIRGRIHRVLVTHEDKVAGIISALDMLKVIRDM